jgi:glutamate--cysteine ligase
MQSLVQSQIHGKVLARRKEICEWFNQKTAGVNFPIYSSYDIRDAGYKVTNVDANIYPAGFNNICPTDQETSIGLMEEYLVDHYGAASKRIVLVTEEHTNNPYYWQNVLALKKIIEGSQRNVLLAIPRLLPQPMKVNTASGQELTIVSAFESSKEMREFNPQLIISNNDFSESYPEWADSVGLPVNPPRELGWYQRKKSRYFKMYNQLAKEFAEIIDVDPWILNVETQVFENFDIADDASRDLLARQVDEMLGLLGEEYKKRGIEQKPFVFVKNNSGTYGLAVIRVTSGEEVRGWNYKSRKKMKAAKGGRDVEEVIIQEGVMSIVRSEEASAEPAIYMIGCELAGGFLRTHSEKGDTDSLNSPGAVYKRLCVSDLDLNESGCPQESVYGWSAKLGVIAIGHEAREMGVKFNGVLAQDRRGCDS